MNSDWYKHAVVYQIYPRSFFDSNGDGIGDLAGIQDKLDYLADLGIDTIWLSPINTSPMFDFGYDVADYRAIDPIFGTMADFDALLDACHRRSIRVLMDLVVNHSSHEHPWFKESRSARNNPKRDWYIWHEGKEGKPPNNWQSVFGGSAWQWDEETQSFYLHSFLPEQPDLNWRNNDLRGAVFDEIEFWLKKGVDGFRLDVVNLYFKDALFRDNPLRLWGWRYPRPYDLQHHMHDASQPEMHPLLRELRQLLDRYNAMAVGEVFVDFPGDPEKSASYLGENNELHLAFDFTVMTERWHAERIAQRLRDYMKSVGEKNWPALVLNNHDNRRSASRFEKGNETDARMKILAALLLTMKGTPFLYYGEEIGMRNVKLTRDQIRDPVGLRYWPFADGRDGERTPMQWNNETSGGFSSVEPWLPVNTDTAVRNVAAQLGDAGSLLQWYKNLIALRREEEALRLGDWSEIEATPEVFAYRRTLHGRSICIYLNFTNKPVKTAHLHGKVLLSTHARGQLGSTLAAYEAVIFEQA